MKVLVVLVLAVFTGCNAKILYADRPKPQIELLTEAFWDYVAKATETVDDTLQMISKSPFFQGVIARLDQTKYVAAHSALTMHEQLPPATKDMIHNVITEAEELKGHVERELAAAQDVLKPYTDNMKVQIQKRVELLKQELAPYAESLDTEAMRAALEQKSEELKQSVKDLQAQLGPYTDDLKLKVGANQVQEMAPPKPQIELLTEAFWDYIAKAKETADDTLLMISKSPFVQGVNAQLVKAAFYFAFEVQDKAYNFSEAVHNHLAPVAKDIIQKVSRDNWCVETELASALKQYTDDIQDMAAPYVEDLRVKLDSYAQDLRARLTTLYRA
ncbi:apolipoprotein A-IV-like isoform X2 [Pseudochaenichthys georgianus]|nr:apolipoprotein A-IV-like [Pseudochaenichthys georgianus]XP_033958199.1 apolipoprotein A-IV-like [Pseudochaenichthys georgianus]